MKLINISSSSMSTILNRNNYPKVSYFIHQYLSYFYISQSIGNFFLQHSGKTMESWTKNDEYAES